MIRALFALALALPPVPAAYLAAVAVGRPDIAPELIKICKRENPGHTRCGRVGLHRRDAERMPSGGYGGQVRLGHLRPWCQAPGDHRWSTRGSWGLWASAHWAYLPPCYQPEWLDVPAVSAWVAARKYLARCETAPASGWCRGTLGPMPNTPAAEYVYTEAEVITALDGVDPGDATVTIETQRDGVPVSGQWWIPGTDPAAAKASTLRAKKVRYTRISGQISIAVVRP